MNGQRHVQRSTAYSLTQFSCIDTIPLPSGIRSL
jgi:hypothetical protein